MMKEVPAYEASYLSRNGDPTVIINGKEMPFVSWIMSVEARLIAAGIEWPWPDKP